MSPIRLVQPQDKNPGLLENFKKKKKKVRRESLFIQSGLTNIRTKFNFLRNVVASAWSALLNGP